MPKQWKSRKDDGRHFIGDSSSGGATVKDVMQEQTKSQYLKEIMKEGTTYDINEIITRMRGEGRSAVSSAGRASKDVQEAEKILAMAEGKIEVINAILEVLSQVKASGRTRIGDSELKAIVRQELGKSGLPPSVLDKV
jgi:hypothetical protein